ncbi:hypothetical protein IscW_ISCW000111, partial [Ixodes scapularis]
RHRRRRRHGNRLRAVSVSNSTERNPLRIVLYPRRVQQDQGLKLQTPKNDSLSWYSLGSWCCDREDLLHLTRAFDFVPDSWSWRRGVDRGLHHLFAGYQLWLSPPLNGMCDVWIVE